VKNLYKVHKNKAIKHIGDQIKNLFYDSIAECRADLVDSLKKSKVSLTEIRKSLANWETEVEAGLKKLDFVVDQKVTANTKSADNIDFLRLAIQAYQSGQEEEAKALFCTAATSTQDLLLDNLPKSPIVQNRCNDCGGNLPQISNYCPICGIRLNNARDLTNTLQPAQPPENQLVKVQLLGPDPTSIPAPVDAPPSTMPSPQLVMMKVMGKLAKKDLKLAMKLKGHINKVG